MHTSIFHIKIPIRNGIILNQGRFTGVLFLVIGWIFFSFTEIETMEVKESDVLQYMFESLLIEHEMFKLGGVLSAMNADGNVTSQQMVITSPTEVDITTWDPGKYILVFKSDNYNSIVATIDVP